MADDRTELELLEVAKRLAPSASVANARDAISAIVSIEDSNAFDTQDASRLRLAGGASYVQRLLDDSNASLETKVQAVRLANWCCLQDNAFLAQLQNERQSGGYMRPLVALWGKASGGAKQVDDQLTLLKAVHALLLRVPATDKAAFLAMLEDMFRTGFIGALVALLHAHPPTSAGGKAVHPLSLMAVEAFLRLADELVANERMRDMGLIQVLASALDDAAAGWAAPEVEEVCERGSGDRTSFFILCNMSRTEAVVNTIRDCQLLPTLRLILDKCNSGLVKMCVSLLVAHVYGADERNKQAVELLQQADVSRTLTSALDAAMQGRKYDGMTFSHEELLHGLQSLTRSEHAASQVVKAGTVSLLVDIIKANVAATPVNAAQQQQQQQQQPPADAAPTVEPGSPTDLLLKACRSLLNMAQVHDLRPHLVKEGVHTAVQPLQQATDARLADTAQGILLQLGKHENQSATENLMRGEQSDFASQTYEVFLSHKRSDAKDFARALYNLLVLRGVSTFLDFEYREELADLGNVVAHCKNLVFILSDNIFDSHWCLLELESAIKHNVNIILVTKEGSRWADQQGNKVAEFPPDHLIATLPESVQKVLTRKSIKHSDEYYQSFVEQLLKKVVKAPVVAATAATAATPAATGGLALPAATDPMLLGQTAAGAATQGMLVPAMATTSAGLAPTHFGVGAVPGGLMGNSAAWAGPQPTAAAPMWAHAVPPAEHGMAMMPWALQQQQQQQHHEVQQLRSDMARLAHEASVERQMQRMEFASQLQAQQQQVYSQLQGYQQQLQECRQQVQGYQQGYQQLQQQVQDYRQQVQGYQQQAQDYRQQVQGYQQALAAVQSQLAALTARMDVSAASSPMHAMHAQVPMLAGLGLGSLGVTQWGTLAQPRLPPVSTSAQGIALGAPLVGALGSAVQEVTSPVASVLQAGRMGSGGGAAGYSSSRAAPEEGLGSSSSGDLPPVRGVGRRGGHQPGITGRPVGMQAAGAAAVLHPQRC